MTTYRVVVEWSDGWWVGTVPELPGVVTQAPTLAALAQRASEAIGVWLASDEPVAVDLDLGAIAEQFEAYEPDDAELRDGRPLREVSQAFVAMVRAADDLREAVAVARAEGVPADLIGLMAETVVPAEHVAAVRAWLEAPAAPMPELERLRQRPRL